MVTQESRSNVWIASATDSMNPNGFGGLPYYLTETGKSLGIIEGGFQFKTDTPRIRLTRVLWNLLTLLRTGRHGGFQYSEAFLNLIWGSVQRPSGKYTVLNIFQLYPDSEMQSSSRKFFYLDQTLYDVFEYYGVGANLPASWKACVLARERSQYHSSEGIVFRSSWAANRAIEYYGLTKDKVHVVLPGANISKEALNFFDAGKNMEPDAAAPLRLVFVGKEWKRKGLDRLLGAMHLAQADGVKLSLTVIGVNAEEVPEYLWHGLSVTWLGFFDKSRDPLGFAHLLARHDIGVLLSRHEAGGVSLREFGRLGLPVLAPDTGGSPEFAMSNTALLFAPTDPNDKIAQALIDLFAAPLKLREMKANAWERRKNFDWSTTLVQLANVLEIS